MTFLPVRSQVLHKLNELERLLWRMAHTTPIELSDHLLLLDTLRDRVTYRKEK